MAHQKCTEIGLFDEALKALPHTTTSSALYKLLCTIRKGVEWPLHKENITNIGRLGCFKQLIVALHSSHIQLIGVSLSILGNICMDVRSTNEIIFSYNGLSELNQVLKRFPKEDGVNGRVFRIIGNMGQYNADIIFEMKPQLVSFAVEFLQKYADDECSPFSEATVVMALRVCRQLLNGRTFMKLIKQFNLLRALGSVLITCSNRWSSEKKDQNILDSIIKFLILYSKYKYYPGIVEMRNTPKGDSLIHLSRLLPLAPKKVVKIIMNFIRISQLKSDLPIPEICGSFVKLLRENPVAQDFKEEYRDYIRCLCFLLDHPANRNNERCNDTIPQLIRVLDELQNPSEKFMESCILIVGTLDKCSFHDPLIKQQLGCNIIGVLVKKMEWLIGSKTIFQKHKLQKKRKRKYSNDYCMARKKFGMTSPDLWEPLSPISSLSPLSSDDEMDSMGAPSIDRIFKRCSSPSSGSESEMVASPFSSPVSSPRSNRSQDNSMVLPYPDLSDSEDYSPVCSDNEDFKELGINVPEEDQNSVEIEKLSDAEDRNSEDNMSISAFSLKWRLLTQILTLLKTYSVILPTPIELCSESLLLVLLKCSNHFHNSITTDLCVTLICRILESHDHLIPLMQTDIVRSMYSLMNTPHGSCCVKCSQIEQIGRRIIEKFSNLAESGRGKGDIANRLILGNNELKKQLVLSIPYVIRNRSIMTSLMLTCGGLDVLMELLLDTSLQKKSVPVVCVLASNSLGICSPQQWSRDRRQKMVIDDYRISDDCANIVTFVLDDNSWLSADRDFLCEKSCFFNSLLKGGFRESNENYVKLHHTDFKALKVLIRLLHCDFDKTEPKDVQVETGTLLDVIMLCDRYLLEDLCVFLTECVQQFAMNAENVPSIYKWSIESKTNILRVESIAYALVGDIEESTRIGMFSNLFNLGYTKDIVGDIQKLFMRYLNLRGIC